MPIAWPTVEAALVAWVETGSGLAGAVLMAQQTAPQPPMPYATVRLSGPRTGGAPWPRVYQSYDPAQPTGQEIAFQAVFDCEVTCSVQVYTASPFGAGSARALMSQVRTSLGLDTVLFALRAAGLAVQAPGDIQDLSALLDTTWQGRAALDVIFGIAEDATERSGYVATVGVVNNVR